MKNGAQTVATISIVKRTFGVVEPLITVLGIRKAPSIAPRLTTIENMARDFQNLGLDIVCLV
jgi:hypothetical protein